MRVRDALPGSYEDLFHELGEPRFAVMLDGNVAEALAPQRLERAIGVIYRPETERVSHYFLASLPAQFDAVVHLDETAAVEPIDSPAVDEAAGDEPPETFPSAV